MNREAMQRILNRSREAGATVLADPPAPDPTISRKALADPPRVTCDLLAGLPADPRARLWTLLDRWFGLDEATHTYEEIHALRLAFDAIIKTHPSGQAWYCSWRRAHPAIHMGVIARW